MALKDITKRRSDLYHADPSTIVEEPEWNRRHDRPELLEHIQWLKDSIKEEGVRQPITCYLRKCSGGSGEELVVTDGHCRLTAVNMLIAEGCEIKTIPVQVEDRHSNAADRILSMITRNGGLPLTPIETGEVLKRLTKLGWTVDQIITKTGYSQSKVSYLLNLSSMSPEITNMVKSGEVSASLAIETVRELGEEKATTLISDAVEKVKQKGKTRATRQDMMPKAKAAKSEWDNWGQKMYDCLKMIIDAPIGSQKLREAIAEAGILIDEMDDRG